MGASGKHREPLSAAKKARGVEMLALGTPKEQIAEELGVTTKTIDNWKSEHAKAILEAADERAEGVKDAVAQGSAAAREMLATSALEMANVVRGIALDVDMLPEYASVAGVRLRAAMTALDRGGVPVLNKLEHSTRAPDDEAVKRLLILLGSGDGR